MRSNEFYDAIIIGAGVIGCATAFELAKRGLKTLNVDALPTSGYGSTSASCAVIRVHYSTLDGTAFAYDGYFVWKNWADYVGIEDDSGLARFRETGCLVMKTKGNGYLEKIIQNIEALGIPYELWDDKKIKQVLPIYDLKCFAPAKPMGNEEFGLPTGGVLDGAVFFPTAGYVTDPQLSAHNLQRAAEANGAAFRFNSEVTSILVKSGRIQGVTLRDGSQFSTPIVVNVAGPHSSKINKLASADNDMRITTRALRQEVAHIPSPKGFDFENQGFVVSDNDIGVYYRPETGNHILVGSEDPECDPHDWVDADEFSRDFTDQWTTQALRLGQRIPELAIPSRMRGVVDLYDVTEDWLPIYDRSAVDGFYMACGTSGNQFKNAPVAGQLMSALIDYCESGNDHDQIPLQFALGNVDHVLDTSTMSRLREINPESSFSVLG
ncbi:MAG TPA: FAD-dependent oxidoreductase [Gammaproteobacteria bacterium]|nr:FAD-dependent oxidoreductase [Gammaproteobacteria bacterium]HHZ71674.1 FAD-binding oxidoreductase [Gammaproteobacteria bacterium]